MYDGTWYEIGRVQTAGGAIFQENCVCTQLIVAPAVNATAPGDSTVQLSCRQFTPAGSFENVTGALIRMSPPGHWFETFVPPSWNIGVNYTVIAAGTDGASGVRYSVEYDCTESLSGPQYCIHVLGSSPTMPPTLVSKLLDYAEGTLGLNTAGLPFNATRQEGCW